MRFLIWLWRALVFFVLFAFALNNLQDAEVRWFFGYESRAPMVFIVLTAFALGCAFGVFAMVPSWWKHRRGARRVGLPETDSPSQSATPTSAVIEADRHPPRDGL